MSSTTTATTTTKVLAGSERPEDVVTGQGVPLWSTQKWNALPVVLREQVSGKVQDRIEKTSQGITQYGSIDFEFWSYWMKTPEGLPVKVTMPDYRNPHLRDDDGSWLIPGDKLYQCTAHALGTWDSVNRIGYIVDIKAGIWNVLNDPQLAKVIMKPEMIFNAGSTGILYDVPRGEDIFVIWENEAAANGSRACCHAARILPGDPNSRRGRITTKASMPDYGSRPGSAEELPEGMGVPFWDVMDMSRVRVSTKNGADPVREMSLADTVKVNGYENRTHAIYRLRQPTTLWAPELCACPSCVAFRNQNQDAN